MGRILSCERHRYSELILGVFESDVEHEQFDIIFTQELKEGKEVVEITTIEKNGVALPMTDPIWKEAKQTLETKKAPEGTAIPPRAV